jgi:hypothetical protein
MSIPAANFDPPFPLDKSLQNKMRSRLLMPFFMGTKLPLALAAGLRVEQLSPGECAVSLPYGWRSQNPFQSIYFAAQCMAAEMSTGLIGVLASKSAPASIAMLVTGMEADFVKKANQRTTFRTRSGPQIFAAVNHTLETGESATAKAISVGTMPDGTEVSRFVFTWSFKRRA